MTDITRVKVMVDWGVEFPVWDISPGEERCNLGDNDLPISSALREDLMRWVREWDETMYPSLVVGSCEINRSAEADFERRGLELAHRLSAELPGIGVVYAALDEQEIA